MYVGVYVDMVGSSAASSCQRSGIKTKTKAEEKLLKNSSVLGSKEASKGGFAQKYTHQDNIFKVKSNTPAKEYREVVISDEFVRSHKLYKMLKDQIVIADAYNLRETTELTDVLAQ